MKKVVLIPLALIVCLCLASGAFAVDREGIKKQVDDIVVAINGGKSPMDFKSAAKMKPYYVFIMEEGGKLLVHPTLAGKSLKKKAKPVYEQVIKATPDGVWVNYMWKGKGKHTYVRKTNSGLIVGSGYSGK
ncbi:MAG: hypothetical protein P8012_14545 [Desulfobacterales bacterium]